VATPRSADAVGAAILLLGITGRVFLRCHHVIDVLCGAVHKAPCCEFLK